MFDLKPKTLYYWYRNYLSDYKQDIETKKWNDKKVRDVDIGTGEIIKERTVYIAKPENIGASMSIDDKQIGKDTYTIMTNQETGEIAFLMDSTKVGELKKGILFLGESIKKIINISCDMAPSYLNFCKNILPLCVIIIDKFHVMKYLYDALQGVRNRIRKEIIEQMPKGKRQKKDESLLSELELLQKSRYLLSQSRIKWTEDQKEIMQQVFENYPELEKAYQITQNFKSWYDKGNAKKDRLQIETSLFKWYDEVEKSEITEFNQCVKMIEKHEENIINYFLETKTNAKAENLNGKIQRFISNNYGVKDKDFNIYRISNYFS